LSVLLPDSRKISQSHTPKIASPKETITRHNP
jgi:hypothetical protein